MFPNSRSWTSYCLCVVFISPVLVEAQYEKYSFKSFPQNEIMPLDSAYGHALDQYGAQNWKESIKYLELSLRLHRLLKDSEAFCSQNCSAVSRDSRDARDADTDTRDADTLFADSSLRLMRHFLLRASCLKKCKGNLPIFKIAYPRRDLLEDFDKRTPYRYIQYAYYQDKNIEKAVSAAHTFLQKNPEDPYLTKNMNYYKTLLDPEGHLIDQEGRPYESVFLMAVKLYNAEDFSSSARNMEQATMEYFKMYDLCLAGCDGSYEITEFKDFYPTVADLYTEVLKCKVKCEQDLTPNVGGFFVEKFVANMYHYLQFAYYKLNDVKNAAPCAASYILFDPNDQVMQQNIVYYRFYREQWGLEEEHFLPRPEALKYYNQSTKQKEMLEFSLNYLQTDDEDVVSPEEVVTGPPEPLDAEFEGLGDYEESFVADWWQEPKAKWDTGETVE